MSAETLTGPVFDHVTVHLGGATIALDVIDKVTAGLERAGEYHAAATFLRAVDHCDTDDEVIGMADALVNLIP